MNTSKKIGIVVAIIVIAIAIFTLSGSKAPVTPDTDTTTTTDADNTPSVAVSETSKVSASLSEYQNAELGISVKYPTAWEKEDTNSGVTFIVPLDKTQVSTVATLQGTIQALPGTCAFPPVTTVATRDTLKVGANTFKTISIANTVQGRNYFNRLFALQQDDICYMFSFASITLAPSSKNLKGSSATQADNNNKAIVNTADTQFTDLVKSFAFVTTPAGIDETQAPK